jgi:hypothetical protein
MATSSLRLLAVCVILVTGIAIVPVAFAATPVEKRIAKLERRIAALSPASIRSVRPGEFEVRYRRSRWGSRETALEGPVGDDHRG